MCIDKIDKITFNRIKKIKFLVPIVDALRMFLDAMGISIKQVEDQHIGT